MWNGLELGDGGSRPLRGKREPRGYKWLNAREQTQVRAGNGALRFVLEISLEAVSSALRARGNIRFATLETVKCIDAELT